MRRAAANTIVFLGHVRAMMPFPIQRIQTDRGQEFFAYEVQDQLKDWRIKFRPTRPRSPHLNGKVERVQRTALDEFWAFADIKHTAIVEQFVEWQRFCNTNRSHSSLGGGTPAERLQQLQEIIPSNEAIHDAYDPTREWARPHHFRWDAGPPSPL